MLKIRLSRGGRNKLPFYRILVTNHTSPRDSKFLEKVGTYNPLLADDKEGRVTIKQERIEYWLSVGAQPTERVAKFLIALGVKGAEKYKPGYEPKAKGSNLKKKALDKLAKEAEAKAEAEAEAEAKKAEELAAAEAKKAEEAAAAEAAKAEAKAAKEAEAEAKKAEAEKAAEVKEEAPKEEAPAETPAETPKAEEKPAEAEVKKEEAPKEPAAA